MIPLLKSLCIAITVFAVCMALFLGCGEKEPPLDTRHTAIALGLRDSIQGQWYAIHHASHNLPKGTPLDSLFIDFRESEMRLRSSYRGGSSTGWKPYILTEDSVLIFGKDTAKLMIATSNHLYIETWPVGRSGISDLMAFDRVHYNRVH